MQNATTYPLQTTSCILYHKEQLNSPLPNTPASMLQVNLWIESSWACVFFAFEGLSICYINVWIVWKWVHADVCEITTDNISNFVNRAPMLSVGPCWLTREGRGGGAEPAVVISTPFISPPRLARQSMVDIVPHISISEKCPCSIKSKKGVVNQTFMILFICRGIRNCEFSWSHGKYPWYSTSASWCKE